MILMLNCSMKGLSGNCQYFMNFIGQELKNEHGAECEMLQIKDVLKEDISALVSKMRKADAFVIGAPLYVDGLPAQAVKVLELLLEGDKGQLPNMPVYVLSNLGFYEGIQMQHLFAMVENWCDRIGMVYGGGLGIGAGPMIRTLEKMPLKSGFNKDIGKGISCMANAIAHGEVMENYYCKTKIPRAVYMKAAHMTFDKTGKKNGLTVKIVRGER